MRQWMTNPLFMCNRHKSGEHNEFHKHRPNFEKKYSIKGRIGQIEPKSMKIRHDELAEHLNHNSPYELPDLSYLSKEELNSKVDFISSYIELITRCPYCREKLRGD